MGLELNEIKYSLFLNVELGRLLIRRHMHPDLFLRLWKMGDIRAFTYLRGSVLYLKVNAGAGTVGKGGKAAKGDVIYDSAEDALGIVLADLELGKGEDVVGRFEGDLEGVKKVDRRMVLLRRL